MLILSISAILFYKIYKKGRYLFNMITKVNDKYQDLFDEVSSVLTGIKNHINDNTYDAEDYNQIRYTITPDLKNELGEIIADPSFIKNEGIYDDNENFKINSLSEYFSLLTVLSKIHPRFIRLPLDEAPFEIDLNKRTITNPTGRNVWAVESDNHAETIYFRCDRYYETVDLGDSDVISIIIQAQCSNIENGDYIFKAQTVDIDSDPGHIIFGWILPEEITKASGTVKFAVRFYNCSTTNDKFVLNYSLNTLATTIQVVPSLSFDYERIANPKVIIKTTPYLQNYAIKGTENIIAPVFSITGNDIETPPVTSATTFTVNVDTTEDDLREFEYHWYKKDPYNNTSNDIEFYKYPSVTVDENTFDSNKANYYKQNGDNGYISCENDDYNENTPYYTKAIDYSHKSIEASEYGLYGCTVKARINRYTKTTETPENKLKKIIWPAEISFNDEENNVFGENNNAKSYLTKYVENKYKLYDNDIETFQSIIEKGSDNGYFNRGGIIVATTQDITFNSSSDYESYTIEASNNIKYPNNETVTKTASSPYTVKLYKPLKALSSNNPIQIVKKNNKFMIEFTYNSTDFIGGEFYDNTNHELIYDCLNFNFKAVPPIDSLESVEVDGLDLSNTTFENGIQYTCTLTCKYNDISLFEETFTFISPSE